MLALIPSLPRPVLERITQRAIDRMDDMDGDPDAEDGDQDSVVDDVGENEDAEGRCYPKGLYGVDQRIVDDGHGPAWHADTGSLRRT